MPWPWPWLPACTDGDFDIGLAVHPKKIYILLPLLLAPVEYIYTGYV